MRKTILAVAAFLLVISFTSISFSHAPDSIVYKYYPDKKILAIGVWHNVKDPTKHFIVSLEIKLNGKTWILQHFSSQTNKNTQAASYSEVNLKKGDALDITATCNEGGELKKTVKVE